MLTFHNSVSVFVVAAFAAYCVGSSVFAQEKPEMKISDEAMEIHQSGMLFDGHNDLPWAVRARAGSSFEKMDIAKPTPLHTDIPRLKSGGLKAQFWSVYVPAGTDRTGNALLQTLEQIQLVHDMCQRYPDVFEMADTAADVKRIVDEGKIASMIGVEGGHSIQNSLQVLRMLYEKGARYMTLTHSKTLAWADSATDDPKNNGLSPFGQEVVREMNRIGMLVDLSHVSDKCMTDALAITKAPVIFSHSSARAICDHPRNVPDEILELTARNGGVVMVNFMSGYVVPKETLEQNRRARGDYKIVCDHIEHIIKIAGIDHVGIGSDYDGVSRLPVGLDDVSYYPNITQELIDRGYDKSQIHKILGGNVLRALAQAEQVARDLESGKVKFKSPVAVAKPLFRITIEAGNLDRANAIVRIPVAIQNPPTAVTLSDANGNRYLGQVNTLSASMLQDASAKGKYELQFVLPKLAKGKTLELVATESGLNPNRNFHWHDDGSVESQLMIGDQPVIKYMYEALDNSTKQRRGETYKVFHHVYTPDGKRLLTKGPGGLFPHHRGLFYGFNRLSYGDKKADVWHCNNGESQGHQKSLEQVGGPVMGRDLNAITWFGQDKKAFISEIRETTSRRVGSATVIDFHSTLENLTDQTIKFRGDPQHAGFQFRASQDLPDHTKDLTYYVRPDGVGEPGKFRNWSGKKDDSDVNRKHINLPWNAICLALPNDREAEGKVGAENATRYTVCYLDSPNNPKPSRFSERDYGRFGSYFEYDLKPGDSFSVNYRVWIQEGEMTVDQIEALSRDFVDPIKLKD